MATKNQAVLILGVEPRITVPVARSLWRQGIEVVVAGLSPHDPILGSRAIRKSVHLTAPESSARKFSEELAAFIRARHVDMLIPVTDGALSAISTCYEDLSRTVQVACPPPHIVRRVLNKEETLTAARANGIRVPREYALPQGRELDALPSMDFPVVAKPREKTSRENFKVRFLNSESQLRREWETGALGDAILQEYCRGEGVGVEMLVKGGECLAAFQHRRLRELPHTGGVAVRAIAEPLDPQLKVLSLQLLRALEWEGVAMVEFRHDRSTGAAYLMEVNGRYWGTVALPIQAGVDFPFYQWQLAHAEALDVCTTYAVGTTWEWTAGTLKRQHGLLRSGAHGVSSRAQHDILGAGRKFDALWSARDPLPAVLEALTVTRKLAIADLKAVLKRILPGRAVRRFSQSSAVGAIRQGSAAKEHCAQPDARVRAPH